jgi:inorganic triphosphatase YgiF
MTRPKREFELKLALTSEEFAQLAASPRLSPKTAKRPEETLRSVYYDTPDHRLHREGLSLRVRDTGRGYIQTLKADTELKDGLSNPIEIEAGVSGEHPDLSRIRDKRLRRRLRKMVRGSSLTQVFETVVHRKTFKVQKRRSVIEVALDKGEARAKGRRIEIREAELELIRGNPADLLEAAQELMSGSAVHLSPTSKAELGYRLLAKPAPRAAIEPRRARKVELKKGYTCGEAFAAIFRSAGQQIVENRIAVLESDEPESAHQLRIGLTRLRSAHRALQAVINSPSFAALDSDAKTIARAVGRLRDADVLIEAIYAPVARVASGRPGMNALHRQLRAHRMAMQRATRQTLQEEAWSRLLLSLTLWPAMLERDPFMQGLAKLFARKALQKGWKKVRTSGRLVQTLEPVERHKMRRALKKLRYMSEFFAPLYDRRAVRPFIKKLKELQEIFGYVNDVSMAEMLHDIADVQRHGVECAGAVGYVLGAHEAKAAEVWESAPERWNDLESVGPFW